MEVEMKIRGLMMDPSSNLPIVVLKDVNGGAVLPIWVGIFEANAIAFDSGGSSVNVSLDNGREIEARYGVLATGYVMPEIVRPEIQHATSSWAIATAPQPQNLWQDGVLIWEDSKDYH